MRRQSAAVMLRALRRAESSRSSAWRPAAGMSQTGGFRTFPAPARTAGLRKQQSSADVRRLMKLVQEQPLYTPPTPQPPTSEIGEASGAPPPRAPNLVPTDKIDSLLGDFTH